MATSKRDGVRALADQRWSLAAGVVLWSFSASAGAKEDAADHYDRGSQLVEQGSYAEAIVEFQKAYALSPHHSALFSLAQVYVAVGDSVQAVDFFRRYLAEAGSAILPTRRTEVEQAILAQEARIGTLAIDTSPEGATIAIDGLVVGSTPFSEPPRVNSGIHRVTATLAGFGSKERSVAVVGGERIEIDLWLEPTPTQATAKDKSLETGFLRISCARPQMTVKIDGRNAARTPLTATIQEQSGRHRVVFSGAGGDEVFSVEVRPTGVTEVACSETKTGTPPSDAGTFPFRTLGYVSGGVGLALGSVAVAHYLWNKDRYETWNAADQKLQNEAAGSDHRDRQLENNALADSIERASAVTAGLAIGGGTLLGGGVLLVLTHPTRNRQRARTPRGFAIAPSSAYWTVSW